MIRRFIVSPHSAPARSGSKSVSEAMGHFLAAEDGLHSIVASEDYPTYRSAIAAAADAIDDAPAGEVAP
jgi:hypothetical protein